HSDDATGPGATAFTSTPRAAYASAYARESDNCPAFATEYAALDPDGRLPDDEETLTTRPHSRSAIRGTAARIIRSEATTFSSHCSRQSSSVSSSSVRTRLVPALFTSTSTAPKCSSHAATAASPASGSITSSATAAASPP